MGGNYAFGQLAKAFVTALTHEDPDIRRRAEGRMDRWMAVLRGMATGKLRIGSRTPVELPAWVTLEVVRGGFATGSAAAGGEPRDYEQEVMKRVGAPDRAGIFAYYLTEAGLGELHEMLRTRGYYVGIPEEAALLTVAWLVQAGEPKAAVKLVERLAPFAGRLRFAPQPVEPDPFGPSVAYRETAAEATQRLQNRHENERVATMREALTVWNPFGDDLLRLWLETSSDGRIASSFPTDWTGKTVARVCLSATNASSNLTSAAASTSTRRKTSPSCARHSRRRSMTVSSLHASVGCSSTRSTQWSAGEAALTPISILSYARDKPPTVPSPPTTSLRAPLRRGSEPRLSIAVSPIPMASCGPSQTKRRGNATYRRVLTFRNPSSASSAALSRQLLKI